MGNSSTSRRVRTWRVLAQVITGDFAVSRIAYVVTCVWCAELAFAMPMCVPFASSKSDIVFNQSAGTITDHSQSAKDIDPYFKSQLYVEDQG